MWLFVMFDLPVDTKAARRAYGLFRKSLLQDGFMKVQFSVYARVCPNDEAVTVHARRVQQHLPPDGEVRCIVITDKQFSRQTIFWGKLRQKPQPTPKQLEFF